MRANQETNAVRTVALFEAFKGVIVLLAGFGLLSLIHHNVQQLAEEIVSHMHLNPARHLPRVFIDSSSHLTDSRLWMFAGLAATYSVLRFVEAYGLWRNRVWAEWFAIVSGGIYVPMELYELSRGIDTIKVCALAINCVIVLTIINALWNRKRAT